MSEVRAKVEYLGMRVYLQADGTFKAWCTVTRQGGESTTEASNPKKTPGEALADALERAGALL